MFIKSILIVLVISTSIACKAQTKLDVRISGKNFDILEKITLDEPQTKNSEASFNFKDFNENMYQFQLIHKKLPSNRSYPQNLDLIISKDDKKLGYLFFAINHLAFLNKLNNFGITLRLDDELVNINLKTLSQTKKGKINFENLDSERFFQDTLLPKLNFQMIRPVIISKSSSTVRSQEFKLDNFPYSVEYKMIKLENGFVRFQHNFYQLKNLEKILLYRVFFEAGSLETIREVMYAGKAFNFTHAPAKLVFYPALGQTSPN